MTASFSYSLAYLYHSLSNTLNWAIWKPQSLPLNSERADENLDRETRVELN
jgi:hypothetical protein